MAQKLILIEDVDGLGLAGDEINVSPGYARNYLLPRKKAMKASPGVLRQLEARKEKIEQQRKENLESAQRLAEKISDVNIEITQQASDDGHLFGSVTARNIADELQDKGYNIDHTQIALPEEHIKETGEYTAEINLHKDVQTTLKFTVLGS
jgi:large subunit ribosomal protein L9